MFVFSDELSNRDHELSRWLRSRGHKWTYRISSQRVDYFSERGLWLAFAVYDNKNGTYKVFVNQEAAA